jgi:HD-GYP domain-containing protein (c-di-GMP phosphodiesterase class II)
LINTTAQYKQEQMFFGISPLLIHPELQQKFSVYLKQKDKFVLFASPNEPITTDKKKTLVDNSVNKIYILKNEKVSYDKHITENLTNILTNKEIPVEHKADVFTDVSLKIIENTFNKLIPASLPKTEVNKIVAIVKEAIKFLSHSDQAFKHLSKMLSESNDLYAHSIQVFVYFTAIYNTYDEIEIDEQLSYCLGAILHDVGRIFLPKHLIMKDIDECTGDEAQFIKQHPVNGSRLCLNANIPTEAHNIILFHHNYNHEEGYPSDIIDSEIPIPVQIIQLVNLYDKLTNYRRNRTKLSPYEALNHIKEQYKNAFSEDVYKRLIMILSGANIV